MTISRSEQGIRETDAPCRDSGRLGQACGETILQAGDLQLAGFVRRPESLNKPLPAVFRGVSVASSVEVLAPIDAALVCLPAERVGECMHDLVQHHIPVVECSTRWGEMSHDLRKKLHQLAMRHQVPAILDAGWDPGALGMFRSLFTLLIPKGRTEATGRPGISLHHTLVAGAVEGVRGALCTERQSSDGKIQRYVHVELEPGAEREHVAAAIRGEPLFLDEETLVLPVESIAALEEEGAGVVLQRRGSAGGANHQLLLLEARFDGPSLAAQVMVAAARALPKMRPGAYLLSDVPLSVLRPGDQ
jgi:diaminopimelate dehydrogenase